MLRKASSQGGGECINKISGFKDFIDGALAHGCRHCTVPVAIKEGGCLGFDVHLYHLLGQSGPGPFIGVPGGCMG